MVLNGIQNCNEDADNALCVIPLGCEGGDVLRLAGEATSQERAGEIAD